MLLPHCLWDCSGRAAIRTFPADLVPGGIEVGSSNISRIALVVLPLPMLIFVMVLILIQTI